MKLTKKEFEGNILVTVSDNEVRLWVCKDGQSVFRFKALGRVYEAGTDITVISQGPNKEDKT